MRVFKFGGASVKDASAVKNVARIIDLFKNEKLGVVISAMGKTTNALEAIMKSFWNGDGKTNQLIDDLNKFHQQIIAELFGDNKAAAEAEVNRIFEELKSRCAQAHGDNYNFEYDQIISLGEVISTKIVAAFLVSQNFKTACMGARKVIRTTDRWREANKI